jgi:hypothetical protein
MDENPPWDGGTSCCYEGKFDAVNVDDNIKTNNCSSL